MKTSRIQKLQSVLRQELAVLISREIKDPRVGNVTVTSVDLSPDAKNAKVFVTLLGGALSGGSEEQMEACLKGLKSAKGFLRTKLTKILQVRYVPDLHFAEDNAFDHAFRVQQLLGEIHKNP